MIPTEFKALVVEKQASRDTSVTVKNISSSELPKGNVNVRVLYSSVNYKDGLASISTGRVVKSYPFVPGIDLSGIVVDSQDPSFSKGDKILATGFELGVSWYGGFSEYASLPAKWLLRLPEGLDARQAMIFGTAGFTAGISLHELQRNGLHPSDEPVIVTGATGGVGSIAVALLSKLGYRVVSSTGKASCHDYLRAIGASEVIDRVASASEAGKVLLKEKWAAAVDPVGGKTLEYLLQTTKYGGSIALCGLTGGSSFQSTVFPFILRGVNLLGIDSSYCPSETRETIWKNFAANWRIPAETMERVCTEITLDDLPNKLKKILAGEVRGRLVVKMAGE